jgi:hypothetical protein
MSESNEPEPKIIVDDDWKTRVQAEKEELKKKEGEAEDVGSEATAATSDEATAETTPEMPKELPPASFVMLITTLGAQAMSALGFMPDPATGKSNPNRVMAKHFIDTIGVLEEKTKGNLTDEEKNYLDETLHQLRMAFVTPPESQ